MICLAMAIQGKASKIIISISFECGYVVLLLMAEILHQFLGSLSHYF